MPVNDRHFFVCMERRILSPKLIIEKVRQAQSLSHNEVT